MTIIEKAAKIVAEAQVVTIASIDENGYPRPVPVVMLKGGMEAIYFSTGSSSAKTAHFKANPKAGLSIVQGGDSVVFTGNIEIINDLDLKRSFWGDWMKPHFPMGVEDPEYCLMKFVPKSNALWIDNVFMKDGKYLNLFCQSCGMPMNDESQFGTEKDGTANHDYCCYCYKDGAFTQDCTMDEMISHCAEFVAEFNKSSDTKFTKEESIAMMKQYFPHLKRWSKQ